MKNFLHIWGLREFGAEYLVLFQVIFFEWVRFELVFLLQVKYMIRGQLDCYKKL